MLEPELQKHRRFPDSVVAELSGLLELFPLLFAGLFRTLASRAYPSDASEIGTAILFADFFARALCSLNADIAETRCRKCWYNTLQ